MEDRRRLKHRRLERLAWLLDSSIPLPGLNFRIGLDGLLGLLPGFGDTLGALASSYILAEAGRLGAPRPVLLKMAFNIALDAILGAIPFLGDLFDFAWKANLRNVRLLGEFLERPRRTTAVSRIFIWGLCALVIAFVLFVVILGALALRWLWLMLNRGQVQG